MFSVLADSRLRARHRGGDTCIDAVEVFAVNCVSVNAELVPSCLMALVKQLQELPLIAEESSPRGESPPWRAQNLMDGMCVTRFGTGGSGNGGDDGVGTCSSQGVHRVLQRIIETFPTGISTLLSQLKEKFPHKRRDVTMQRCFLGNLLRVLDYVPQIAEQVLLVHNNPMSPFLARSSPWLPFEMLKLIWNKVAHPRD